MQYFKKDVASYALKEPPETYICSHNFNLSLASICKIPVIANILDIHKSVIKYFSTSQKR